MSHADKSKAWGRIKKEECPHGSTLGAETASAKDACEECGWTEDLRICLTCGYVGCCESHAAHNTAHFKSTGHALIQPHRSQYSWTWCYKCNAFLE